MSAFDSTCQCKPRLYGGSRPVAIQMMKRWLALLIMVSSSNARAGCHVVPTGWVLGAPVDPSVLAVPSRQSGPGDSYYDSITALKKMLKPGEKIVPYNDMHGYNGQAGGTSGYALVRNGCIVWAFFDTAI